MTAQIHPSAQQDHEMVVERDVMVTTRDGSPIAVNVFRPSEPGEYPVIVSMSPYGKDVHWPDRYPLYDLVDDGEHMVWETENPDRWVPNGYVLVRADTRGTGHSPGFMHLLTRQEPQDCYDVIEWAAQQSWSNGRIGMSGISWYATMAWRTAALRPPHLAAIIPWDGLNDLYREWGYQGGILHANFNEYWWNKQILPNQYNFGELSATELAQQRVDLPAEFLAHPWADEWHSERSPVLEDIEVPVLSASAWGSLHIHLRGNVEGFHRVASEQRRLLLFPGDHITPFYTDWGLAERQRFFDHWLKGEANGAEQDAPVRLGLRDMSGVLWRDEDEWPLARTEWTSWPLDMERLTIGPELSAAAKAGWSSPEGQLEIRSAPVDRRTEITGPMVLRLWLSTDAPDADVYVGIWQLDGDGAVVPAYGIQGQQVPHSTGMLRASHRQLDEEKSLPSRPFHPHRGKVPLPVDQPIRLDIEIWPTSIILEAGHSIKVVLSSVDGWMEKIVRHDDVADNPSRFAGTITVHSGPEPDSALLLPIVPE